MSEVVYLNGDFRPLAEARVSPLDRGFLFGDGVFETMRAESGRVLYLGEHLERLERSLADLKIPVPTGVDWPAAIDRLLRANRLTDQVAAVKVVVSRGVAAPLGLPAGEQPTVFIHARPYQPPASETYRKGWRLHLYREGFAPPLARHKSLNYLFYLMAREVALERGADEAVILDRAGHVAETAAGSLLVRSNGTWSAPATPDQLPGITVRAAARLLEEAGQLVAWRTVSPEQLAAAQTIWVLNSLMGVMPVSYLDDRPLAQLAADEARQLRNRLFAYRISGCS